MDSAPCVCRVSPGSTSRRCSMVLRRATGPVFTGFLRCGPVAIPANVSFQDTNPSQNVFDGQVTISHALSGESDIFAYTVSLSPYGYTFNTSSFSQNAVSDASGTSQFVVTGSDITVRERRGCEGGWSALYRRRSLIEVRESCMSLRHLVRGRALFPCSSR